MRFLTIWRNRRKALGFCPSCISWAKKSLYLYWITLSATKAVLPWGPVRVTPHRSSDTTGGNCSTRRKPAMLGRVKLDNTLLTCDQGNFNQITARSRNQTIVTVVRDTCTTTVPPAPQIVYSNLKSITPRGWCSGHNALVYPRSLILEFSSQYYVTGNSCDWFHFRSSAFDGHWSGWRNDRNRKWFTS